MKEYYLAMAALGVGLGAAILLLVRRDHLYIRHALFWMAVALASVILGIWPGLIDVLGQSLGVAYPPALLLLLAIVMLIVRAVVADMAYTRLRREVRMLNQRVALIEAGGRSRPMGDDPPAE